jgi:transposase InsO family protein
MPGIQERMEMSQRERDRLVVIRSVNDGKRSQVEAARLLGLSTRQLRRLQRRVSREKDSGVIHKLRGRPSNNACAKELKKKVLSLYREDYGGDYGPTLFSEKLCEQHEIALCPETLRHWLLGEGLWQRKRRRDPHRRRRERRACFGELVQADGSHHPWLEDRGPRLVLCVMIDDATSRIVARFYEAETTEAYFDLLGRYIQAHGRPVALYSDQASIFRTERKKRETDLERLPQFARALEQLDVRLILARSPQAKGRVERLFGTLQDRWVKELREAKACTIEQANALLERKLLKQFNDRFTVQARSVTDAHRASPEPSVLNSTLCEHHERVVANDYTVRFQTMVIQILPPALPGLRGGSVRIEAYANGVKLRFKDQYLPWSPASRPPAPNPRRARRGFGAGGQFNFGELADSSTLV